MTDTVDITGWTEMYDRLVARIATAIPVGPDTPLPDKIIMTKRQQKMLRRYPQMSIMYGTTQRLWQTPHNVMEVTVDDRLPG